MKDCLQLSYRSITMSNVSDKTTTPPTRSISENTFTPSCTRIPQTSTIRIQLKPPLRRWNPTNPLHAYQLTCAVFCHEQTTSQLHIIPERVQMENFIRNRNMLSSKDTSISPPPDQPYSHNKFLKPIFQQSLDFSTDIHTYPLNQVPFLKPPEFIHT